MLKKWISVGEKVELCAVLAENTAEEGEQRKKYLSKVNSILSDDMLEITMPMEKTRLVLLQEGDEFELTFFGGTSLYKCTAQILKRYKSQNIFLLKMGLTSPLQKYQRRQYYRMDCLMEMQMRLLDEQETESVENDLFYQLREDLPMKKGVIADISGGGMRFLANEKFADGSLLYCVFQVGREGKAKKIEIMAKVLRSKELPQRKGTSEYRVQFYMLNEKVREYIISWIFEEEGRLKRKGRFI